MAIATQLNCHLYKSLKPSDMTDDMYKFDACLSDHKDTVEMGANGL